MKDAKWTFRGGYLYHGGAAPAETVTPLLPEGNRNEFTAGATGKLSRGLTPDLAYPFIRQNDRRGPPPGGLFNPPRPHPGEQRAVQLPRAPLRGVAWLRVLGEP